MSMPPPTDSAVKERPAASAKAKQLASRAGGGAQRAVLRFIGGVLAGPQRGVAFGIVAGVVGLVIAGAGLLHSPAREATKTPPGVVALVNGEPVLMSDFVTETETRYATGFDDVKPQEKAAQLHDMIDQELMVQRALALDLPEQDTNVRSALGDSVTALVVAQAAAVQATDAQLEAYYNAHRAQYATHGSMSLTDLVLHVGGFENVDQSVEQALADAQQAVFELRSGAALDYVKQHFAMLETGKVSGEEPDFAARIHLGDQVYAAAEQLTDGQVSSPVIAPDGVHVLIMGHRTPPIFYDYASVKNNVYSDFQSALKAQAKADNLKFLRRGAKIILAPGQRE